jgi:hypothetical protein
MVDTARLELEVFGPDTVATLTVTPPRGAVLHPNVAVVDTGNPADAGRYWRALVPWTMPGLWREQWVTTGTGANTHPPIMVSVAPATSSDTRHTYADTVDLANALQGPVPIDAERRLRDATSWIDRELLCAVYPVDDNGMPTLAKHVDALRDAVCAVVKWWDAIGEDGTGSSRILQSASIGGVSLGWKAGDAGGGLDMLGGEARQILAEAGLFTWGPWS